MRTLALSATLLVILSGCKDPKPEPKPKVAGQPPDQAAARRIIEQSEAESKRVAPKPVVRKEAEPKPAPVLVAPEEPKKKKPTMNDVDREVIGLGYCKSKEDAVRHKEKALTLLKEMIDNCGTDRDGQVRKARLGFRYIFLKIYGDGGESMPGLPYDAFAAILRKQRFFPEEIGTEYGNAERWRNDLLARGRKEASRDAMFKNKP